MLLYLAVTIDLIVFSSCSLSSESLVLTLLVTYRTRENINNLQREVYDYRQQGFTYVCMCLCMQVSFV